MPLLSMLLILISVERQWEWERQRGGQREILRQLWLGRAGAGMWCVVSGLCGRGPAPWAHAGGNLGQNRVRTWEILWFWILFLVAKQAETGFVSFFSPCTPSSFSILWISAVWTRLNTEQFLTLLLSGLAACAVLPVSFIWENFKNLLLKEPRTQKASWRALAALCFMSVTDLAAILLYLASEWFWFICLHSLLLSIFNTWS